MLIVLQELVEVSVCLVSVMVRRMGMIELCGLVSITRDEIVKEYPRTEYPWV